ncbi:MAG: DMT family transporter [Nakamurella sp.]
MNLLVAIPCALGAAVAYGVSAAVQHHVAHTGTGRVDPRGLLALVRDPRWLASMLGDGVGLVLQIIALSAGPVVLIAPLFVLAVPVSLPAGWLLGGHAPRRRDYWGCALIIAGLATFFALLGNPAPGTALSGRAGLTAGLIALVAFGVTFVALHRSGPTVRAFGYGVIAGAGFGLVEVLVSAVSTVWATDGARGFTQPNGYFNLVMVVVVGVVAITFTQLAFQVGPLAASFPANECAAPAVAVLLGAILLHEPMPANVVILGGYLLCLLAVVAGTVALASDTKASSPRAPGTSRTRSGRHTVRS